MAKPEARVRLSINDQGDIVLWVGELGETITETGADSLINMVQGAKDDSKEIKSMLKKIATIRKPYNSVGKPIEPDNLKEIAEGESIPAGVVTDER